MDILLILYILIFHLLHLLFLEISIRLPENMNDTLKKIAKKENMSFNNVIVSCIQNSLDEMDLNKYKDVEISDAKEPNI